MPQLIRDRIELRVNDGTMMSAYVARPEAGRFHSGILVFQEAFGVNGHIREVTDRFAREGYIAVAPELFHRTAPGFEGNYADFESARPHRAALKNETMEADIHAAYEWIHAESNGNIASVGFCLGGRASFLANASVPLKAAVSFYGGGIAPGLLDRIPKLHSPMMMFWGGLDKHISPDEIRAVTDALRNAKKDFTNIEFSYADHAFFCDARPNYNNTASIQAWELVRSFLQQSL